ncbi:MFS transporter [Paraburkholderia sp. ZP32-5]|uniref:MFS transporter n=1 Tax=Paraburkholderia sp. ZP32-5 TaxID=2883245 RepID=UPI001F34BCAB|nr:MFS transporter [Paraburkholderia sp. ZP32-5]
MSNSTRFAIVIDVQEFIDRRPLTARHMVILVLCLLMMVADGFDTASIGFVVPALMKEWGVATKAFGLAVSASVVGLALGAIISGPIADKLGRKPVLLVSVAGFGIFSLAATTSTTLTALAIWRFLTGLGLGAASPNATTLLAEWVPARCRAFMLNLMYCGFTLGAAAGGFLAGAIIPAYGWKGVFVAGGLTPLIFVLLAIPFLPESTRFMVAKKWSPERIRHALASVGGVDLAQDYDFRVGSDDSAVRDTRVWKILFSDAFRSGTIMMWIAFFMGNTIFYMMASWLPTMIRQSGIPLQSAAVYAALFPLGGAIGGAVCGRLMDRMNPHISISGAWTFAGIFIFLLAGFVHDVNLVPSLTFLAGFMVGAALISTPTLAAMFYPTQSRASGVSWMAGVGRLGGVVGAYLGALLLGGGLAGADVVRLLAVPALAAALAIACKGWLSRGAGVTAKA